MKEEKRMLSLKACYGLIFSSLVLGLVIGASVVFFSQRPLTNPNGTVATNDELQKVTALYEEIQANYVGEVDQKQLIDGALKGMTDALDDPYSSYLDEEQAEQLNQSISGSFEGIGATLSLVNEQVVLAEAPLTNSPAAQAGLRVNDVIVAVDGEDVTGLDLAEVVAKIRGEKGSEVRLMIQRDQESFEVKITRDTIKIESVSYTILADEPTLGYLKISTFSENTADELEAAIKALREEGAQAFVIDLRQNPGGLLDQVERMVSMFLEDGQTIIQFENKAKDRESVVASNELDKGFKVTEPTAVLIDEGSASASEIFAAALQEAGQQPVIGQASFGKGTVQTIMTLTDNSELKLTILKWLTPEGNWIHEKGVTPDIEAGYPDYAYLAPISRQENWQLGMTAEAITNINKVLRALDYDQVADSPAFDEATAEAVKAFQTQADLPITGQVDDVTADALEQALIIRIQAHDGALNKAIEVMRNQ